MCYIQFWTTQYNLYLQLVNRVVLELVLVVLLNQYPSSVISQEAVAHIQIYTLVQGTLRS